MTPTPKVGGSEIGDEGGSMIDDGTESPQTGDADFLPHLIGMILLGADGLMFALFFRRRD